MMEGVIDNTELLPSSKTLYLFGDLDLLLLFIRDGWENAGWLAVE